MGLYKFYRISKPSAEPVEPDRVEETYRSLRRRTFWGATIAYSLYYVCRMSLSVVKQPLIDEGVLTAGELGLIGSALLFVYAVGKFMNGFIADYCNVRRFMATGLFISALVNLLMGAMGLMHGPVGIPSVIIFAAFAVMWGLNGWAQSMGSPPGVISLSRWFPQSKRGTYYSLFSSSPYIGEFLSFIVTGFVVGALGWEYGFLVASVAGLVGSLIILLFVSDTPESKGLPSVQTLSGEQVTKQDRMPTRDLQKMIVKHPGIWVIALSSAFIYVTKYAIAGSSILPDMIFSTFNQSPAFCASFHLFKSAVPRAITAADPRVTKTRNFKRSAFLFPANSSTIRAERKIPTYGVRAFQITKSTRDTTICG